MTPQETDPDLPGSVQESLAGAWIGSGLLQVQGTECSSVLLGLFEGGHHYLHYLHHSLLSGQITGRGHSPTHQQKIVLKIYWAWPHPSEQDPVSPLVSLSHQEASISLLSFSVRGQTENHNHRKLPNLIAWTTALSYSMKLWAMLCRVTQHEQVMVESSDKTWPIGEGNGKPLQYSCFDNPLDMNYKHSQFKMLKSPILISLLLSHCCFQSSLSQ